MLSDKILEGSLGGVLFVAVIMGMLMSIGVIVRKYRKIKSTSSTIAEVSTYNEICQGWCKLENFNFWLLIDDVRNNLNLDS